MSNATTSFLRDLKDDELLAYLHDLGDRAFKKGETDLVDLIACEINEIFYPYYEYTADADPLEECESVITMNDLS